MKKIIALLACLAMLLSMAACADSNKEETTTAATEGTTTAPEDTTDATEPAADTVGTALLADFKANPNGTAQEIADRLITNSVIQFMPATMPVEAGFLSGFDTEITGFEEAVMFSPMIGTIPFVGYIFTLADGADVEAFKTTLSDNANLRWNICTAAEEMIVESDGNTVFFLMCPTTFEQPEGGEDMPLDDMPIEDLPIDELPVEDVPAFEGTVGEALLAEFQANPTGTAQEIADRMIANPVIAFMPATMPMEPGFLSGFDSEITGFEEAVMFSPMIGTIPFVGYIFTLAEGADVEAFKTTLSDNANLRWNICTAAEEMVVESEGNTVFFLMCPTTFEQPEGGEDMPLDEMPLEEVPAADGEGIMLG